MLFQTAEHPHQIPPDTRIGSQEILEVEEHQHLVSSQLTDRSMGCFMVRKNTVITDASIRYFNVFLSLPLLQFLSSTSHAGGPDVFSLLAVPQPGRCVCR